ncbi:hypothetical protein [Flavobacterium sp. SOK18b]|uniref:hypothetical protein n=1 Tax=Flavobacterium sp. SOK18b TaxID=797900 RepID=UPI0015FA7F51|nr:hypothetical protein [Flavobacterium sp. SOK18b]
MGVQSEDLDTVSVSTTSTPTTTPIQYEDNDSSNYYKKQASETSNAEPTSKITEKDRNAGASNQNDAKKVY